ncbi:MAG: ABC transporter permease [Stellaceae bacterium]
MSSSPVESLGNPAAAPLPFNASPTNGKTGFQKLADTAGELWVYRELLYFFAWRDLKIRYKQAVLGVLWAIIQPVFTMVVFTILFGKLANLPNDGLPSPVFYLSGLVPWLYFSGTVTNVSMSLVGNADMLTKIYFPRVLLPAASAFGNMVDFAIGTAILLVVAILYGVPLTLKMALWPFFALPLFMLALGVGMVLAALNVKYRDIRYVVPFAIQLCLFATPIIYPASMVPERYRAFLVLNPLSGLIEGFRDALNPGVELNWGPLAASLSLIIALFVAAAVFFRRHERAFADYV